MNRILLIIGGLLVGILAAAFVAPRFIDWTRYRGTFEEQASRVLGREVRVGGNVNLRLLPTPFIRFEKLRVADSQGSVGEPLFKAEDFTIWLSTGGLAAGRLEATEIELRKPVLTLVMDEKGAGNWASLASGTSGGGLPGNIKLNSVRVTNGAVHVFAPGGEERALFERINGEISAETLAGPWKAVGAFASQGRMRDLRVATAAPQPDGTFRIRGTVRAPESGVTLVLDGQVSDFLGKAGFAGELTADCRCRRFRRLFRPPANPAKPAARSRPKASSISSLPSAPIPLASSCPTCSFRSSRTAGHNWRQGLPASLGGSAPRPDRTGKPLARSRPRRRVRWIDPPLPILQSFAAGLGDGLPSSGRTTVKFDVDQVTLGGDVVSRAKLEVEKTEAGFAVSSLGASVPGGGRIEGRGAVTGSGDDQAFAAPSVFAAPASPGFLTWATRSPAAAAQARRDGPFSITGDVNLDKSGISGRKLSMQVAGSSLTGDISYRSGQQSELSLALEGTEIDVTPLLDGAPGPIAAVKAMRARSRP